VISGGSGSTSIPLGVLTIDQPQIGPLHYQYKIGLSYRCIFELLYAVDVDYNSQLFNHNMFLLDNQGATSHTQSVDARFYPIGGIFLEAGYGRVTFVDANDYSQALPPAPSPPPPPGNYSTSSKTVTGGIGWAGDISYLEVRYVKALQPLQLHDYPTVNYHNVIWGWGIQFRL
jgi:hypothetical protein